ncbi:heme peroxidase [Lentinula aciculospora]|uniref:Heme peroxidase n=1 Tax=Lentinula aciculospora TaxID=153920 RepID=A0A9W9AWJ4_9AGAR|nr:heme peroxidase [Lentinula aciculospora]
MDKITPLQVFELGADDVYLKSRAPPTAPDGRYDWQVPANANQSPHAHSGITNLMQQISTIKAKSTTPPDIKMADALIDQAFNPNSVDDRKGGLADGLDVLATLPEGSEAAVKIGNAAIGMLYNTVPHPPAALMGEVHSFRHADGGGNNLQVPNMGRAGTPYARSVQSKWCSSSFSLPDPNLVFETLLKRRDILDHPGGNSSLTFAFASLVTHSLFRTDYQDMNINNTSSYLDLSPVYGYNQAAQDVVRDKAAGRGLLFPDTFSEERLLFLPPAASALLVVLSRNHNYIAETLLKINERGTWTDPPPADEKARARQDEDIFQTARLINGGHFMSLIMGDYVPGFLGLSEGNSWNMNAFDPITNLNGTEVTRGQGNHCSVEFNVMYRWHATTSAADEKWTENFFQSIFTNKPLDQLTPADFGGAFFKILSQIDSDPSKRTFAGLQRGPDGRFSDDDLANILHDATENAAGAYRARGTPAALKVIEVLGIQQARQWGVCTMNEFRQYLGLKTFDSFEDWNPQPEIANAARRLYKHIDNLELYTGLQCEATMPLTEGLRFACGYTMTRAILGDAIALIRGDRFYTTEFTPANLTTWGYQDTMRDPNNGGLGGNLPKLLTRHLPRHYPFNSVYACYPFFTPQKMKDSLTRQKIADQYTFTRPVPAPIPKVLNTFTGIKYAFNDPAKFHTAYQMSGLGNGYGFMLAFDADVKKHDADKALALHAIFPSQDSLDSYRRWYRDNVIQRIKERSWTYDGVPGRYVDIVNDVINVTSVHWAADRMCGIDVKTKDNPSGLYTEQEIYDMFSLLSDLLNRFSLRGITFLSFGDNEHLFSLSTAAFQAGGVIQALVAKAILEVAPGSAPNAVASVASRVKNYFWPSTEKPYYPFLSRLSDTGRPLNELVANVVSLAIGSSVNYAEAAVNVIDFYLDDERAPERAKIVELAKATDDNSTELLRGYVREAMRLNPQYTGLYRDAVVDAIIPQGPGLEPLTVKAGDRIWASFKNAHRNPADFPDPLKVDPTRPKSSYNLNGTGYHQCPGVTYAEQTIAEIVKVTFSLPNVRRADGNAGRLGGFTVVKDETETNMYLKPNGTLTTWPGSMFLVYDA